MEDCQHWHLIAVWSSPCILVCKCLEKHNYSLRRLFLSGGLGSCRAKEMRQDPTVTASWQKSLVLCWIQAGNGPIARQRHRCTSAAAITISSLAA
eukprot:1157627-Pelagomonas_calceolata.AAC.11